MLLLLGCSSSGSELIVDVRTDWLPGVEFVAVRTSGLDGSPIRDRVEVTTSDDYLAGERVAEIANLQPQTIFMRVELLDASDRIVAARPMQVELRDDLAVTVVVTRDCRGVMCSGTLSACQNGVCVDPRCLEIGDDFCPEGCDSDLDCSSSALECVEARCIEGACYLEPDDALCPGGTCSIVDGCLGGDAGFDGGVDAPPPDAFDYTWMNGGFGGCSRGFQNRSVWCERSDGMTVDDALCPEGDRPASSRGCAWTESYGARNITTPRLTHLEPADNGNCQPGCAAPCTGERKEASECRDLCESIAASEGRRFLCAHTACLRSCRVFNWQSQGSLASGTAPTFAGYPPGDSGP